MISYTYIDILFNILFHHGLSMTFFFEHGSDLILVAMERVFLSSVTRPADTLCLALENVLEP